MLDFQALSDELAALREAVTALRDRL